MLPQARIEWTMVENEWGDFDEWLRGFNYYIGEVKSKD